MYPLLHSVSKIVNEIARTHHDLVNLVATFGAKVTNATADSG